MTLDQQTTSDFNDRVRRAVREAYTKALDVTDGCCSSCCCAPDAGSGRLGYTADDQSAIPADADLGLGCGNPVAIASLRPGEVVADYGSGAGIDCFLAANQVGPTGRVIGVDMTPAMLARAREIAASEGFTNVEFREGTIEDPPLEENSIDVIISNCVINLSPDKPAVLRNALRALKPGGRLAISDVVAIKPLPQEIQENIAMLTGCVSGAALVDDLKSMLAEAGFEGVSVNIQENSAAIVNAWSTEVELGEYVASARIEALKPKA